MCRRLSDQKLTTQAGASAANGAGAAVTMAWLAIWQRTTGAALPLSTRQLSSSVSEAPNEALWMALTAGVVLARQARARQMEAIDLFMIPGRRAWGPAPGPVYTETYLG